MVLALLSLVLLWPGSARAGTWEPLIDRLVTDGFDRTAMEELFNRAQVRYDHRPMRLKMRTLNRIMFGRKRVRQVQSGLRQLGYKPGPVDGAYGRRTSRAIRAFQRKNGFTEDGVPHSDLVDLIEARLPRKKEKADPAKARVRIHRSVYTPRRLAEAREFMVERSSILRRMEDRYGLDPNVAVGILTVETRVGKYLGARKAFITLASMSLGRDFKRIGPLLKKKRFHPDHLAWLKKRSVEKADWAYRELAALITYAQAKHTDPLTLVGSVYGAIGISQFMPTNALKFGVDGDSDGDVDLFSLPDAVHSLGNYMKGHGWVGEMAARPDQRRAIYAYNHSYTYVDTVLAVADHLRRTSPGSFNLPKVKRTVSVSTGAELLAALDSDTRVILKDGVYILAPDAKSADNPRVTWGLTGQGAYPILHGLENLIIQAEEEATILAGSGSPSVLALDGCKNVHLANLKLGPALGGSCRTGVVEVRNSERIGFSQVVIYSAVAAGLVIDSSRRVEGQGMVIRDGSCQALRIDNSQRIAFRSSVFRHSQGPDPIRISKTRGVEFKRCIFRENALRKKSRQLILIDKDSRDIALRESYLVRNKTARLANRGARLRLAGNHYHRNSFKRRK